MFFDCSSNNQKQTIVNAEKTETRMENLPVYQNKVGDVEYTLSAKILKKGASGDNANHQTNVIQITYELKNTGDKSYLVYNRGHFGTNDSQVYVEPQKDGSIEISQKAFAEPADRNCPQRFVAIVPNASWLKAKQTVNNQVETTLPLKVKTPFDDCTPLPEMPDQINQTRFCLGIAEADPNQVKIDENGFVQGRQAVKEQQLLCSDNIELK